MEIKIVHFFNHLGQGTIIDPLSFYFSWIPLLTIFWFILALVVLIFDKSNGLKIFLAMILVALIYFVINDLILKQGMASIYFRQRPYVAYPNLIMPTGEPWSDSSFWSGHMAITAAFLTVFLYFYRRWWVWVFAGVFLLLMAFSRLHNGMHYPSDVLAGTILGIGYGALSIFIVQKIRLRASYAAA